MATSLTERRVDAVAGGNNNNKVKSMASQLLAKFEENAPVPSSGLKRQVSSRANVYNSWTGVHRESPVDTREMVPS